MKKVVLYPVSCLSGYSEVMQAKEPKSLHNILWIIFALVAIVFAFLVFGKVDDVVKAEGIVRPETNVSFVKNITSGEISELFYKPGDFVHAGDKLLSLKRDAFEAQKKSLLAQKTEALQKVKGLESIMNDFKNKRLVSSSKIPFAKARYSAFISESNLLEAKKERAEKLYQEELSLPEFSTTKAEIETKKFESEMAALSVNEYSSNFISNLRQEYDQAKLNLENLTQELAKIDVSLKNLIIQSPVDGYVQEVSSLNPGDYIFSDQQILNIIPSSSSCRIELNIPANEMGKIKKDQTVHLRFPAFPYSEFRGIDGRLKTIQPDAQNSSGALVFKAYAESDSMTLKNKSGTEFQIKPGFAVDARIVLENQSLLHFLLKKLDWNV